MKFISKQFFLNAFKGTLMPHFSTSIVKLESNAKFVLLVEKDTVFEKLLKDGFLLKYSGNCILITVKF